MIEAHRMKVRIAVDRAVKKSTFPGPHLYFGFSTLCFDAPSGSIARTRSDRLRYSGSSIKENYVRQKSGHGERKNNRDWRVVKNDRRFNECCLSKSATKDVARSNTKNAFNH